MSACSFEAPRSVIAVVGPLPRQMQIIRRELKCSSRLVLLDKERRGVEFPTRAAVIVLWVSKLSHSWDVRAVNHAGRDNVFRHRGGVRKLIRLLKSLLDQ